MTKKLWQKNYTLNEFVEAFETKGDLLLDQQLVVYDLYGTIAHATMLEKMGILSQKELLDAHAGLQEIYTLFQKGEFILTIGDEDIHTKIENFLTEKYGKIGEKIHTGRSRNDQVLTALRLYTLDHILQIWECATIVIDTCIAFAKKYQHLPMPGYTHMQKAMPYSVGAWGLAFACGLLDDLLLLETSFHLINQSPLGSAAGFGVSIPLDKTFSAQLLGFEQVQINSLSCQNSRGKLEAIALSSCIALLADLNKFASDILLFTTSEFDFFSVNPTICTGSSIMPQKKNIDIAELIRSKQHIVLGNYVKIVSLSSNLISGYSRDLQDMKAPLFESLQLTIDTLLATKILVQNIKPKENKLKEALSPNLYATHIALEQTKLGIPFRQAYTNIAKKIDNLAVKSASYYLKQSKNLGDTGNLHIEFFEKKLQQQKLQYEKLSSTFTTSLTNLLQKKGARI